MTQLITPSDVAHQLDVTEADLEFWRSVGLGPAWMQLGSTAIRYVDAEVHHWVIGQHQHPEAVLNVVCSDDEAEGLQTESLLTVDSSHE